MERVFCGSVFKCVFLNVCEPFAFKNFSILALPFKNSTYFTCLSVYIDLSLHYVDCICLAYQKSTLWKTKSEDGGQIDSICFALNCPIFEMKIVILTPFLWSVLERKVF